MRGRFPHPETLKQGTVRVAALALLALLGLPAKSQAQDAAPEARPFAAGEVLAYRVTLGAFGTGEGHLRVAAAEPVRGQPVVLLRFDFDSSVGPFKVRHHSRSWLAEQRFASLRYEVDERTPLGDIRERAELFPEEQRWAGEREAGSSPSAEPLDELSFIYLLRTVPLAPGGIYQFPRHYDARRGLVKVRVLRREPLSVPAGEFQTVVVEMEVRDPKRYGKDGRGVLRLYLTDDARRLPVRMESQVPVAGQLVLQLRSVLPAQARVEAVP
jgi:hypothetical protein